MTVQDSTNKCVVNVPSNVQIAALPQHENAARQFCQYLCQLISKEPLDGTVHTTVCFAALLETSRHCVSLYIDLFLVLNIPVLSPFYFFLKRAKRNHT